MIVKCPSCSARLRIDRQKLAGKRLMLRCSRCRSPFRVELPRGEEVVKSVATRVMLAHTDRALCRMMEEILTKAGMATMIVHDGESLLAMMSTNPPQVAVVDVALQGLYAFEVVEKVRQRTGLENIKIILLSSVYSKTAYKRAPSSLYDAHDYIEKHHIPDDLVPKVNQLIVDAAPAHGRSSKDEEEQSGKALPGLQGAGQFDFVKAVNERIKAAEDKQVEGESGGSELDRATRLARNLVSDVALYCQEQLDAGIRGGNWGQLLAEEVKETRRLFRERFPDEAIHKAKVLEKAFLDLLQHRQQELGL